jgi:secretion/DNA translocation related CpaE-like protein
MPVLIVTSDQPLLSLIERCAAASGCDVVRASDDTLAREWLVAPMVIIGVDALGGMAATLPRRTGVVVARLDDGEPDSVTWRESLGVGAEHVIVLPDAQSWLVDQLGSLADVNASMGSVTAVLGCAGGVGASTLALALGAVAAGESFALVVDADPWGGGLECIAGSEGQPGARWPSITSIDGRMAAGALVNAFPTANGASLLSFPRRVIGELRAEALATMMDGARRSFDHIIVDLPCSLLHDIRPDHWIVLAADRVRPVLTARALLDSLGEPSFVALRRLGSGSVDPKDAARVLGCAITVEISHDRVVAEAGEHGDPLPNRGPVMAAASVLFASLNSGVA